MLGFFISGDNMKKKLKYSSIPVQDEVIEKCYQKYLADTGIYSSQYVPKRSLIEYILNKYLEGK